MARLSIRLLGPFQVARDGQPVTAFRVGQGTGSVGLPGRVQNLLRTFLLPYRGDLDPKTRTCS